MASSLPAGKSSISPGLALIIMGVSGSGKSTIGSLLASSLGCAFLDADDFHSIENREKMKQGIPLTDSDRLPWLETLRDTLIDYILWGKMVILACSALQPSYRSILRTADFEWTLGKQEDEGNMTAQVSDEEFSGQVATKENKQPPKVSAISLPLLHRVQFFLLNGPIELFASRLEHRFKERTHFMPPSLLQSQMDSFNINRNEEDIIFLDASTSPEVIVAQIKELVCHNTWITHPLPPVI